MTTQSRLTLTKLKTAGGEETPRFEARLHFNGREVALVSNGGTGGSCTFYWTHPKEDRSLLFSWAREEAARQEPSLFGEGRRVISGEEALDFLVLIEVDLAASAKRLVRAMKTRTLVRFFGDEVGVYRSIPIAYVPGRSPANDPRVSVCLNALDPRDAALRLRTAEPAPAPAAFGDTHSISASDMEKFARSRRDGAT